MSSQKRKKSPSPWIQCDNCSIALLNKDDAKHMVDCPPNLQNCTYNFVQNQVLTGTLDIKANEDVKALSSSQKDNLVFLSQSSIQLCSLAIGDWAVIQSVADTAPPIARVVWPTVEKSLTSVLLTRNGLNLSCFKINETVRVSKIRGNLLPAKALSLVILNGSKILELNSELKTRISKSFEGRILTLGNRISVMFYGKVLIFEVKTIEASEYQDSNLENDFSRLCIGDQYEFFVVDGHSKWKLYKDAETYENESPESLVTLLAGVEDEMQEIRELMQTCLHKNTGLFQIRSVLLYGNSGTGKTSIATSLANEFPANVIMICVPDLYKKSSFSPEDAVKELFQDAIVHVPSIIILDEIDILCPGRSSRLTDSERRIVNTLLQFIDQINNQKHLKIFVMATSNKPDNIDPAFRRCGRLDREIEIPVPNPKSRKAILKKLLEGVPKKLVEDELQEVAMNTHGFVGADLVSLCSSASLNASKRDSVITLEDLKSAMKRVGPSAMREVQIEVPNVKWSDIGGQENLKLILRQSVEWPLKHSASFLRLGITPPRGVLMFGPPGCSKTMIAKALATESGLNFLSIKGPELFSKWVGESERAVREVFRKARQVAPSVIFFDEIDALGSERISGSSSSVQERVLAQLLTELDGVTPLGDVTILAATNRPDRIDKALLRPGRLDRIVYVPLPDENTRKDIFRIKLSKMPILNVDIEDLVKKTEGYSGAEVNAVCQEAAMAALVENLEIQHVESRHFEKAVKLITPRTPPSLIKLYEDYMQIKI